jgi:hypothetical protein
MLPTPTGRGVGSAVVAQALYAALYMPLGRPPAARTQVYLTQEQRAKLAALQRRDGRSLAEHVRIALDAYLADEIPDMQTVLDETFGVAPAFTVPPRSEWDRG